MDNLLIFNVLKFIFQQNHTIGHEKSKSCPFNINKKSKMTKKIDIKRTLGKPTIPLSIEDVEAMTRLIHNKTDASTPTVVGENPKMNVAKTADSPTVVAIETPNYEETTVKTVEKTAVKTNTKTIEKTVEPTPLEKLKRGRKPKMLLETERLLRVSVDLPESLFIQLKIAVIQQQTDMKTYIRQLVEKDRSA